MGVIIAFSTLANQKETELAKQVENTIEWSASNDALKRWEAIHRTKRLVKSQQLDFPLALNILGTVARNSDDEKLLIEVYEAIEDIRNRSAADLANLSKSDQLELLCLEAAMTPERKLRQVRLFQIEKLSSTDELKSVAASKLLSLSKDLYRPDNVIDMLMSIFYAYSDPATLEKAIPIQWDAFKVRDVLGTTPDTDVVGFLETVAMSNDSKFDRMVTPDKSQQDKVTQAYQSQIGVYLACALVAKDQNARDSFLAKFEQITKTSGLDVAAQSLLGGIYRSTKDANLQDVVKHAADALARYEGKPAVR